MDEVSNSCTVWRVPIGTKDVQDWLSARKDRGNDGNEVAWFLARILTQQSRFMAPDLTTPH
jgi:hypothetical protein